MSGINTTIVIQLSYLLTMRVAPVFHHGRSSQQRTHLSVLGKARQRSTADKVVLLHKVSFGPAVPMTTSGYDRCIIEMCA